MNGTQESLLVGAVVALVLAALLERCSLLLKREGMRLSKWDRAAFMLMNYFTLAGVTGSAGAIFYLAVTAELRNVFPVGRRRS